MEDEFLNQLKNLPKEKILSEVKTRVIDNPLFSKIIEDMIDSSLYNGFQTSMSPGKEHVIAYNNKTALDVISDSISREIVKGFRDGFGDNFDGASNVSYSNPSQNNMPLTSIGAVDNTNDAITCLASEVQLIKQTLSIFFSAISSSIPPASQAAIDMSFPAKFTPTSGKVTTK